MGKIIEEKGKYMFKAGSTEAPLTIKNVTGANNAIILTERSKKIKEKDVKKMLKSPHYNFVVVIGDKKQMLKVPPGAKAIFLEEQKKARKTDKAKKPVQKGIPLYGGKHGHVATRVRSGEKGKGYKKRRRGR